jgi:CubicO group peptidase (beta-lactamase class C family)
MEPHEMTDAPLSTAELEAWIERTLEAAATPGAAVVLERNGETLLARGFGRRDAAAGLAADVDTVFGSGSVTKSVTALAILLLEEDGRLSTGDAVVTHLPDLRLPTPHAGQITIHHLLTHTAGLPPLPSRHYAWLSQDDLEPFERTALARLPPREPIRSFDELIVFLGEHPFELHAAPGAQFSYSNEGYNLLGAIIERVSGQSMPTFVRDRILAPAGMRRSSLDLQFTLGLDNVTRLFVRQDGEVIASSNWFNPVCWAAAGALRTTASDLARFFRMLASGGALDGVRIASPGSIRKMTTSYAPSRDGAAYAYGLMVSDLQGHALVHHGGGHKGVSAMAGFAPADGLVCIVLTNFSESPAGQIWAGSMRSALGAPPGPLVEPRPPISLPPETLRSFAGVYRSPEGAGLRVSVDDAGAIVVSGGELSAPALPIAEDAIAFDVPGGQQTVQFCRLDGGKVSHAFLGGRLVKRAEPRSVEAGEPTR